MMATPQHITGPEFYEDTRVSEARRLSLMAARADQISLDLIGNSIETKGAVLVDVGAGDSVSLGKAVLDSNPTSLYLPIDVRSEAVEKHIAAGFLEAREGSATELPLASNSVDILHARFTLGWLGEEDRRQTIQEMLRVGKDDSKLVVVDYDWTVASGPPPAEALIARLVEITQLFGFNPYYGSKVCDDISLMLGQFGFDTKNTHIEEVISTQRDTLSNSLEVIDATVQSLLEILNNLEMQQEATELAKLLGKVRDYAHTHPDELLTLPNIVGVVVDHLDPLLRQETLKKMRRSKFLGSKALRQEAMISIGPKELKVYKLATPGLVTEARRLHAWAYTDRGYITTEGLKEDGTLIESIDPPGVVEASTYLGIVKDEGTVTGCIRLIEPLENDLFTLPTIARLQDLYAKEALLADLSFLRDAKVFEGSALARSSGDRAVTGKLFVAIILEAAKRGFEYGVVSLVDDTARLLRVVYGEQAFRRIGDDSVIISLTGKGLRQPQGITLEPYYVEVSTFMADCLEHFNRRPESATSKINIPLFETGLQFMQEQRHASSS